MKDTLTNALSLGIGGMIGGGIFILNGLIVLKNKGYSPYVWLIAVIIALIIGFSYILLSLEYKSNDGTILYPEKLIENKNIKILFGFLIILAYVSLISDH